MKSVTEFANFALKAGLAARDALVAEGKALEEVAAGLGEKFKYEGDKLKHFVNSLEVAHAHQDNLKRVVVMSVGEGENAPAKAVKVEEHHYVPEFQVDPKAAAKKVDAKGGKGGKGGGRGGDNKGGPKESPWGLSPEQKAEKAAKGIAAQQAAAAKAAKAGAAAPAAGGKKK